MSLKLYILGCWEQKENNTAQLSWILGVKCNEAYIRGKKSRKYKPLLLAVTPVLHNKVSASSSGESKRHWHRNDATRQWLITNQRPSGPVVFGQSRPPASIHAVFSQKKVHGSLVVSWERVMSTTGASFKTGKGPLTGKRTPTTVLLAGAGRGAPHQRVASGFSRKTHSYPPPPQSENQTKQKKKINKKSCIRNVSFSSYNVTLTFRSSALFFIKTSCPPAWRSFSLLTCLS